VGVQGDIGQNLRVVLSFAQYLLGLIYEGGGDIEQKLRVGVGGKAGRIL